MKLQASGCFVITMGNVYNVGKFFLFCFHLSFSDIYVTAKQRVISFNAHSNRCQGKYGLVWIEPLFSSVLSCWTSPQGSGMLDSELLLWFLVPLQVSVKHCFPLFPFCLICVGDTCACLYIHLPWQTIPRTVTFVTQVPSLNHVVTTCASSQTHFSTTGAFTFSSLHGWEEWLLRGRAKERKLSVSITSKAVWLRKPGDTLHLYKLARHSEIVPLINNLKL